MDFNSKKFIHREEDNVERRTEKTTEIVSNGWVTSRRKSGRKWRTELCP